MTMPTDLLGRGFPMPFRPTGQGAIVTVAGADAVRQAIETILSTEPGERIGLPTFGCGLRRFLMEPNTTATRALMAHEIGEALNLWEERITVESVEVTAGDDPSLVWIAITYTHRAGGTSDTLVYPFYLS